MSASSKKIFLRENTRNKNPLLRKQTQPTNTFNWFLMHVTEPISAWKLYFHSPSVEICAPILYTTQTRPATDAFCTEWGDNFSVDYLIHRMGTWKRIRPLKRQQRRLEEEEGKKKSYNFNDEPISCTGRKVLPRWEKSSTLFFFYKNVAFPAQAEYSYFSADSRLKIFLYYS